MKNISPSVAGNLRRVRERIATAAARAGRRPQDIRLVAVSKDVGLAHIQSAMAEGVTDFGESRIQEAEPKIRALPAPHWHMVGHLQRNKVAQALSMFSVIHSVDSERLAAAIGARTEAQTPMDILLQVNIAREPQKFGIDPRNLVATVRVVASMSGLRIIGVMTVAPQTSDPEKVRPFFRELRQLRDEVRASGTAGTEFEHLSMGMSDDFEMAIEEGATMVRVGRAIFGG